MRISAIHHLSVRTHLVLHLPLALLHLLKHHGQRPWEQPPVLVPRRAARDGEGLAGARLPRMCTLKYVVQVVIMALFGY
jgi:hypothetical protein